MIKQVILTGLRANKDLHIGNYMGALLPIVSMANQHKGKYQINLFMPDLHSFTTPVDHSTLYETIINNIKVFVASGLDLNDSDLFIYRQSYVPAHSELTWIVDCFTGFGEMSRMIEFKDKSAKFGADKIGVGQFNYPALMASDILLYGATYIPVGDDQRQHIEFTRDIAIRMNSKFGELFVIPKSVKEQNVFFGSGKGLRIYDFQDPIRKMSKSDSTGKGVIFLNDTPEAAKKKILGATTDSLGRSAYNRSEQPGLANIIEILAIFTNQTVGEVCKIYVGQTQYGPIKSAASDAVCAFLLQFQAKLAKVDEKSVLQKLETSELAMNKQANKTLHKVQVAIGIRK